MFRLTGTLALALLTLSAVAQTPPAPPLPTHQVNADGSITFRYTNRAAMQVDVTTDAVPKPLPMTRDDNGVWTATTPALTPEIYSYAFKVDGVDALDPRNTDVRRNFIGFSSNVLVPGTPPQPWEATDIAHGGVEQHFYTSHVVEHLPNNQSTYLVYTPPGYDPRHKGGYPVLYLVHGWSDYGDGWVGIGKANFILDSLIDSGKAVPMIVVMPLGYGDLEFVLHTNSVWEDPAKIDHNAELFSQALESEVIPAVEREYNIAKDRDRHAIIGLSMGGLESLYVGLNHTDQFAWIGGMSSAIHKRNFDEHLPHLDAKSANLRLLWVACGTGDSLIQPNRDFAAWAKAKGLNVTAVETPGQHTWLVWRDNLLHFAPLLFRK